MCRGRVQGYLLSIGGESRVIVGWSNIYKVAQVFTQEWVGSYDGSRECGQVLAQQGMGPHLSMPALSAATH